MLFGNMSSLSNNTKFKFLAALIAVFVVVSVAVGAFYSLNGAPDAQVNEMEDDMQVNIGSGYPGSQFLKR